MKQIILIIAVLCISATTIVNNITVTPAKPKFIIVQQFQYFNEINPLIKEKYKEGYIVKTIAYGRGDNWGSGVLIMEKY